MIYLFYGTDADKAHTKAREVVDSLLAKRPDAAFFKLDPENWSEAIFQEYIESQGLFAQKYIVFLDRLFQNKEIKEQVAGKLKELKASTNIFIVLEGTLDKATLTKFEKNAEKVQEFAGKEIKKKEAFNMFSMTDALGARDQKRLWMLYQTAVRHEAVAEELHGMLFWQLKSMLLAAVSKDAKEAGLNPFVYSKAKAYGKNFTTPQLKAMSARLVSMYHEAHRGRVDFDRELEKFALGL